MNWTDYLYGFAEHAASKSKDTTKVGAALVGPEGEVRLTAFNGPPRGVEDRPYRFERPSKYLFASHAEVNLIAFAAREGIRTKGCTVYVTHHPCASCARTLIQAGVERVVYGPGTTSMPADEFAAAATMFAEADLAICSHKHLETA
jgi:dCMP deaminase